MCLGYTTSKGNCGRDLLRELQHTTAYVNCAEWTRARPLLQSVLSQLKARRQGLVSAHAVRLGSILTSSLVTLQGRKRKAAEGYILDLKCENTAEFLAQLPGMCQNEHCLSNFCCQHHFEPVGYVGIAPPQKPAKYIVVDHVERIADSDLLAVLLKAREITGKILIATMRSDCDSCPC